MLAEGFIRLHERKTVTIFHWTKTYDDWLWLGEQIGKWLDASTYAALIAGDQALLERVHELIERLAESQEEDGYLGIAVMVKNLICLETVSTTSHCSTIRPPNLNQEGRPCTHHSSPSSGAGQILFARLPNGIFTNVQNHHPLPTMAILLAT
jgi:hypothetical protein